jgi:predicted small lipoprotein YifL
VITFRFDLSSFIPIAGALAFALTLAGCGVKGPLEPPPSAGIQDPPATAQAPTGVGTPPTQSSAASLVGQPPAVAGIARGTTSAAVTQAPAAKERSVLDWLID